MQTADLEVSRDEYVWTVTINRPRRRNALDDAAMEGIRTVLADAEQDERVIGIVFAGAGDIAFCAGSDLKAVAEMSHAEQLRHVARGQRLMDAIEASPFLTIAAVNGFALGGGFELALACDLIVAGDNAQFGLPELKNGMIPSWGGTFRLSRAIGLARARSILLGGEVLTGVDAVEVGLAVETVSADQTVAAARGRVEALGQYAPRGTIDIVKHLLLDGVQMSSSRASRMEHLAETVLSHSDSYGVRG